MKKVISKVLATLGYKIEKRKSKEAIIFEVQKKLSQRESPITIFDVGANVGGTVLEYHKTFGSQCRIYAFEPFADSFDQLEKNTRAYPNISVFQKALGHETGETIFNVNSFPDTNSILDSTAAGISNWGEGLLETQEKIKVPMQTIDDFVREQGVAKIDILKLDTQGSEYLVLEGAKKSIAAGLIKLIFMEMIVMPTYRDQKDLHEILKLLKDYGYDLYNLYKSLNPEGQLRFLDGIFVYKK